MKNPAGASTAGPARVAFVLVPRFNMMMLAATIEPMRVANYLAPETLFEWEYRAPEGGEIVASNGMSVSAAPIGAAAGGPFDVVAVCGSWGCEHYTHPALFRWLRRQARDGAVMMALESGAYLLARAGLLADRLATTHWSIMAGLAEQFPDARLREQLFTVDGPVTTCAGGTAGLDLMLHLIAERHGHQLVSEIADQVLHPVRAGESPQRRTMGAATDQLHPNVKAAIALIEEHIDEPWPVPKIAARLRISQRQIERLFRRHLGCSVVQFSQLLRLQYARVLLTSTRMSIREVSVACGFNSLSYFSQAFARCFARKPSEYRQAWPETDPAPSWPGTLFSFVEEARRSRGQGAPPPGAGRRFTDRTFTDRPGRP